MSEIVNATDESFEAVVLQSDVPVLVDFWGDHCAACVQIAPVLERLAEERVGRARIVKVKAADNPRTSARYGVRAMPTVLAFRDGAVCGQLVGARSGSDFAELLDSAH